MSYDLDTYACFPHKAMQVHFSRENHNMSLLRIPSILSLDSSIRTFGFTFITYNKVSIILLPF